MIDSINAGFCLDSAVFDDAPKASFKLTSQEDVPLDILHVELKADGRLTPGTHALMLSDRAVKIEVPEDASLALTLRCIDDENHRLLLDRISLDFSSPIRIVNIITTLDELSALVVSGDRKKSKSSDFWGRAGAILSRRAEELKNTDTIKKAESFFKENATPVLGRIADTKGWKKFIEVAGKTGEKAAEVSPVAIEKSKEFLSRVLELGEEAIDRVFDGLCVSKIEIEARDDKTNASLALFFTGEIVVGEKRRFPMDAVEIPELFMSRFGADLRNLLAQFCVTSEQGTSLSRTFLGMINNVSGACESDFVLSPASLVMTSRGNRTSSLNISAHRCCHASVSFDIKQDDGTISFDSHVAVKNDDKQTVSCRLVMNSIIDKLVACGENLAVPSWNVSLIGHGDDITGRVEIDDNSMTYPDAVDVTTHDPRLIYDVRFPLLLEPVTVSGSFDFGISAQKQTLYLHEAQLEAAGKFAWNKDVDLDIVATHTTFEKLDGDFSLNFEKNKNGRISAILSSELGFAFDTHTQVTPVPEFHLNDSVLHLEAAGRVNARICSEIETENVSSVRVELGRTSACAHVDKLQISRDPIVIVSNGPACLDCRLNKAAISDDGLDECSLNLAWQFCDPMTLQMGKAKTQILDDELLAGHLTATASKQGYIRFSDGDGFYDDEFFNALLYPEHGKAKLASLFNHQPLFDYVDRVVSDLTPEIGPVPSRVLARVRKWLDRCRECGIPVDLHHAISMPYLAKMIDLFLYDRLDEADDIQAILDSAVKANGIDRYKTQALIDNAFPDFDLSKMASVIRLADMIVRGAPYQTPPVTEKQALCDEFSHELRLLPSANQIYDLDEVSPDDFKKIYRYGGPCLIDNEAVRARIYKYAAGFTVEQLEWILNNHGSRFTGIQQARLQHLVAVKRRILKQEPKEGSFFIQDFNIDHFLQSLLEAEEQCLPSLSCLDGCLDDFTERCTSNEIIECFASWMTPEDVSRLLCASIMSRVSSQIVQLNLAELLEYMVRRGRVFSLAVWFEAGAGVDRILASLMMSFLAKDQGMLREPVDRVKVLSDLLGIEVPNRADFIPGGRFASGSYFEKLLDIARIINASSEMVLYQAAKLRMRSARIADDEFVNEETPKRPAFKPCFPDDDELAEITRALEKADALGKSAIEAIKNDALDAPEIKKAQKAYAYAVRLASAVWNKFPDVFEKTVFKAFYARIYESFLVHTLVQNLREDVDEVRRWFEVRSGIPAADIETLPIRDLLPAVAEVLYYREDDRAARLRDPLSWIDLRPEPGPVDLTILFAPGVITEGAVGAELRNAFDRLAQKFDVRLVRSDTGNIKSLDYNAEILKNEIQKINSPFMLCGYSQGCANMMDAEAGLYASNPSMRACLDNLVARHFVFSAFNGSPQSNIWADIFCNFLVEGEKILKSFAALVSFQLSDIIFGIMMKLLDSPMLTMALASLQSLNHFGLEHLYRDAQYMPSVISTEVQGVITKFIPENLDYFTHHFNTLANIPNDSQIGMDCSHGYCVYNRNPSVDILRRESIPSCTLNAHHWSPLYDEVAFVETQRDVRDAVYHAPKDIHVLPAVEALILFGRLKRR